MARLDEIEKDLRDRGEEALKSTVPIYRPDEGGQPDGGLQAAGYPKGFRLDAGRDSLT